MSMAFDFIAPTLFVLRHLFASLRTNRCQPDAVGSSPEVAWHEFWRKRRNIPFEISCDVSTNFQVDAPLFHAITYCVFYLEITHSFIRLPDQWGPDCFNLKALVSDEPCGKCAAAAWSVNSQLRNYAWYSRRTQRCLSDTRAEYASPRSGSIAHNP